MDMKHIKTACRLLLLLTLLTGLIYPLSITGLAKLFFPWQANGSLITKDGKIIGSKWIGQSFTSPAFFHGRPSSTTPFPYNANSSSGSNLALTNPLLINALQTNIHNLHQLDPENNQSIPMDLVTFSASGLDPDISPAAAYYQVSRIAKVRGISADIITHIVDKYTIGPLAGFIGESRVNVLALNMALEQLKPYPSEPGQNL